MGPRFLVHLQYHLSQTNFNLVVLVVKFKPVFLYIEIRRWLRRTVESP